MPDTPREASMKRALRAACLCLGFALAASTVPLTMGNTGCATSAVLKGLGEPCTRTSECERGLSCITGVCAADPGVDAAMTRDAGADARASVDAGAVEDLDASVAPIDALPPEDAPSR